MARISEETKIRIRGLAEQGMKQKDIAATLDCNKNTIASILAKSQKKQATSRIGLPESQLNWTWADWKKYWAGHSGNKRGRSANV